MRENGLYGDVSTVVGQTQDEKVEWLQSTELGVSYVVLRLRVNDEPPTEDKTGICMPTLSNLVWGRTLFLKGTVSEVTWSFICIHGRLAWRRGESDRRFGWNYLR